MKLVVVKSNFQVLLVPNYRVFRITVIYVNVIHRYSEHPLNVNHGHLKHPVI